MAERTDRPTGTGQGAAQDRQEAVGRPQEAGNGDAAGKNARQPSIRPVPIIVIAVVAVLGWVFLRDQLTFETLKTHRDALIAFRDGHYWATVAAFMAAYVAIVAFSLPGATIATLTGGFLFGLVPGLIYNVTSATLGAVVIFLAARWGFGERLGARMAAGGGRVQQIKEGLEANQWSMLFLIRLVPIVPFFVANLMPSVFDVPLHRFVISTFFGIIPGGLVYTALGASLGEVFARGQTPDLGIIFEPPVLAAFLGLAALALLPVFLRRRRQREEG